MTVRRLTGVAFGVIAGIAAGPTLAQGLGLSTGSKHPVVIEADKGVEWRQKEQVYLARGNATATQEKTKIRADLLAAHYNKTDKGNEIWKVTATGGVKINTAKETITARRGIYLIKSGVFRLTGGLVKIQGEKQTVTATDRIEYHTRKRVAYVVGNATVVEPGRKVRADRFIAYMAADKGGNNSIKRVAAVGNVIITTENEVLRGDRADYDAVNKMATLTGNVRLTRGDNQLNGTKAIVDLNTGVSRMVGKVQGMFVPRDGEEGKRQRGEIRDPAPHKRGSTDRPRLRIKPRLRPIQPQ